MFGTCIYNTNKIFSFCCQFDFEVNVSVTVQSIAEEKMTPGEDKPKIHQSEDGATAKSTSTRLGFAKDLCCLLISILLMTVTVFMFSSCIQLLELLRQHNFLDSPFEFGQRILLFVLTLAAPTTAYLSQMIPSSWMLLAGAIFTAGGCASQFLSTQSSQISIFAISAGVGCALIFHAAYVSLARIYYRHSVPLYILLLLTIGLAMYSVKPLMNFMDSLHECIIVLIVVLAMISVISGGILIQDCFVAKTDKSVFQKELPVSIDDGFTISSLTLKSRPDVSYEPESHYTPCFITWIFLFSWWALGVDLTWLSYHHHCVSIRVVSLQSALSLVTVVTPLVINKQIKQGIKFGSHFLALGLIGIAGLTVVSNPAFIDIFHLLFPVAYITQIMDLVHLIAPSCSLTRLPSPNTSSKYQMLQETVEYSQGAVDVSYQSVMLILLAAIFIIFVNPLAYVCYWLLMSIQMETVQERIFLAVLSIMAIGVSLLRPKSSSTVTENQVIV